MTINPPASHNPARSRATAAVLAVPPGKPAAIWPAASCQTRLP